MARESSRLTVHYSPKALASLDEIWEWNTTQYEANHADAYVAFLKACTDSLAKSDAHGKRVPTRPELRTSR